MLRRSHRKTKKGSKCQECRRRHIRSREPTPSVISTSSTTTPPSQNTSTQLSRSASLARNPLPNGPAAIVNMVHLELLTHFITRPLLFTRDETEFMSRFKNIIISLALSVPYLMHEVLAFSAQHLSTQATTERSNYYLEQSTQLQTWALAHFDPAPSDMTQEKCVALFIFSSILGLHALAEVSQLDLAPEPFLIRFGHYHGLHRGTIVDDYLPILLESEVRPVLEIIAQTACVKGRGSECYAIRELVTKSTMGPVALETCHQAVNHLQSVFDECKNEESVSATSVYKILMWPILTPEKLVDLFILRRPEAMIILAYYGVTIHKFCRDHWLVGQLGRRIVQTATELLGNDWADMLRWPREQVGIIPS
ncbi:hypothetical protein F5Y16DRAFT_407649 [Xylariaceae sp. FL0255]|nr:hypothetical protein F5Y16DRAFT_407649 [Xylariaceae sp. FL0255]